MILNIFEFLSILFRHDFFTLCRCCCYPLVYMKTVNYEVSPNDNIDYSVKQYGLFRQFLNTKIDYRSIHSCVFVCSN